MTNFSTGTKPLRRAALNSAISLGLGFGYSQIIRFISSIILAKLLYPEAFGLMALAYTVMTGLQLFSDIGIRSAVVQNKRGDDPHFLNTAWTLQILRGFLLWFLACLLAWPAAFWRPEPAPALLWLLPLIGFSAVFDGFTSTKLFTLSRQIAQGREVIIEVIAQTLGVATTITWALVDRNILALAAGSMLTGFVKMLLSHLILPGLKNRLCWERSALKDLAHFAKWIYLGTMFTFVAQYADRIVVGLDSIKVLGVYHFARQLADIPAELMLALGGKLIFPIYSRFVRSETDLHAEFPRVHLMATAVSALLLAGILATGPTLIRCLYDQRYQDAAWILPLLAAGSWFRMLESNAGSVFFAKGLVRYSAYSNAAKAGSLLVLMPLGYYLDDLRGLIVGFSAGDVVRYAFTVRFLRKQGFYFLRHDVLWTIFVASTAVLALEVGQQAWSIQPGATGRLIYVPRLLVQGCLVVLCWLAVAFVCRRRGYLQKPQTINLGAQWEFSKMQAPSSDLALLENPPVPASRHCQKNGTMRISFLLPPVNLSGGIRVIAIYADRLRQRGHHVTAISVSPRRPSIRESLRMLKRGKWPSKPKPSPSYFDHLSILHQRLPHNGPIRDSEIPDGDAVVATWWQTAEWVAQLSPSKGAKVHFMQDYEIWGGLPEEIEAVHRLPIPRIVLTRWMSDLMRQQYGQEPIALIPNSVDQAVFHAPARGKQAIPTVGTVYAEKPYKGTDVCIRAIEIARQQVPNLKVRCMGNFPPTPELPLPAETEFTLQARDKELRQIYSSCDVWLFGTRVEGFGLPILEAMACRTPVIGTPAGAAPDLLSQGGGIMVPMEDPQAMAQAIVDVCRMKEEEWKILSDRALETVTGYTWEDATDRFEAALRQVVAAEQR